MWGLGLGLGIAAPNVLGTAQGRLQLVANRFFSPGQAADGGGPSNSNFTRGESRHLLWTPDCDEVIGHRVAACNWKTSTTGGGGEVDGANVVRFAHYLETVGGVVVPYTWNGVPYVDASPGATLWSDPHPLTLAGRTKYFMRSGALVFNSGDTWPQTVSNWGAVGEEGGFNSTSASSQLASTGTMTNPGGGSSNAGSVMPAAMIGYCKTNGAFVAPRSFWALGDSIPWGITPNNTADGQGNLGYFREGLFQAGPNGTTPAQCDCFKPSDRIEWNIASNGSKKQAFQRYATDAFYHIGRNGWANGRTLLQVQTDTLAAIAIAQANGIQRTWVAKALPSTTSSDSWATPDNQVYKTGFAPGGIRDQYNAWLDTLLGTVITGGVVNFGPAVEDPYDHCKWQSDGTPNKFTSDGDHTSDFAKARMASIISFIMFAPSGTYLLNSNGQFITRSTDGAFFVRAA